MNASKHPLWVEKYRPSSIQEYVFRDEDQREHVSTFIREKTIPHLLFSGPPGSGKTTLARLLVSEIGFDESDVLTINASDDRGIDDFRTKVKSFALSVALGEFKVIHLEEADKLTADFQDALKSFMEENSDFVRFILTCNKVSKIEPAIRSRCTSFTFMTSSKDDIAEYLVNVLHQEQVAFDLDVIDQHINASYPDIRQIVTTTQLRSASGVLKSPVLTDGAIPEYITEVLLYASKGKWNDARKLICSTVTHDQWDSFYTSLYQSLPLVPKFSQDGIIQDAIVIISEHLYKHAFCADSEINATSMVIKLCKL